MKNHSNERGSFTIEAILALSVFMFAFLAIVSLASIARTESVTQYAINQTAKEVSQYFYIAEKFGITQHITTQPESANKEDTDNLLETILQFSSAGTGTAGNESSLTDSKDLSSLISGFSDIKNDVSSVESAAQTLYGNIGPILENPQGILNTLTTLFIEQAKQEAMGRLIAQPLCRALVPKYISENNADDKLTKLGIVGGVSGLDFRLSSFLSDGRSINIVLIYQIKVNGFGIFNRTLNIKQTASTAAWITGKSIAESVNSRSIWEQADIQRGKEFAAIIRKENGNKAVEPGKGIDLYDQSSNTFTEIYSMNIFSATYSSYSEPSEGTASAADYSPKESAIKSKIKSYANNIKKHTEKLNSELTMADGRSVMAADESISHRNMVLVIVVPEEALACSAALNSIANEIQSQTGVLVTYTYRDKALGTNSKTNSEKNT